MKFIPPCAIRGTGTYVGSIKRISDELPKYFVSIGAVPPINLCKMKVVGHNARSTNAIHALSKGFVCISSRRMVQVCNHLGR